MAFETELGGVLTKSSRGWYLRLGRSIWCFVRSACQVIFKNV
jgi:hypothetical protein